VSLLISLSGIKRLSTEITHCAATVHPRSKSIIEIETLETTARALTQLCPELPVNWVIELVDSFLVCSLPTGLSSVRATLCGHVTNADYASLIFLQYSGQNISLPNL